VPDAAPREVLDRAAWHALAGRPRATLSDADLVALAGVREPLPRAEVDEVYAPLAWLCERLRASLDQDRPFLIGLSGSVAVGKSTAARVLAALLAHEPDRPEVALVTTDGFLEPNAVLEARDLLQRKGWPESYRPGALRAFADAVRSGGRAAAPRYSHVLYDIVPHAERVVEPPDVLLLEGLNVLQPDVAPLLDLRLYLDAEPDAVESWYVARFHALRRTVFRDAASYFHRYAALTPDEATETAHGIWHAVNLPNLEQHVGPTKAAADLVLRKDAGHAVVAVELRAGLSARAVGT
jgi:type I pantothenate kinase